VIVYLIDGTYELFRAYYGAPSSKNVKGEEIAASRTLARSLLGWLRGAQVTHVAIAFDTVIESFRNDMFAGYKTGAGIDPNLYAQFALAEQVTRALGITTWSMIDMEADDALATAALRCAQDPRVTQVRICSPDKDLCQCVIGERVVLHERKSGKATDEAGVLARLGVTPSQVPAYLALVGDSADGIPGIPRWGAKSAQALLAHYGSLSAIPDDCSQWSVSVRGAAQLADNLRSSRAEAALYEQLATLRTDASIGCSVEELAYNGMDQTQMAAVREVLGDETLGVTAT
jgi:5'-3' exonuclease